MFVSHDGRLLKSCKTCCEPVTIPTTRTSYDLDDHYATREEFIEAVSSLLEQHDDHKFNLAAQSLRIRAAPSANMYIETDVSMATCAQIEIDIFDCTGYYIQSRRCTERNDEIKFSFTCSRSTERQTERDPLGIQRYTIPKEFFDCHGQLHIILSKDNGSAVIVYDHKAIAHKFLSPRQIYQNLIRMAGDSQFEKTDLHTITRQQVYNVWLSFTRIQWERDPINDFLSAQLLIGEQDGYQLVEGLQEPGVSLAFVTPCFSDTVNYDPVKMSEIFVDSIFNTNKHGYELYCVLTEYDLVSLPLSYLLLDTHGIREEGKRGSRLTAWFTALQDAALKPNIVHTDKDFAEVTAASLAFKRNNPAYKHHLYLLRAIDQHITGKTKNTGAHSVQNAKNSIRKGALQIGQKLCTREQAAKLRAMIKCHLLRHPLLQKDPRALVYETYEEIHASCPKIFRCFWINWYRPEYAQVGSRWEIASMCARQLCFPFIKSRVDVLCYVLFTDLVPSRIQLRLRVEAGREVWRRCALAIDCTTVLKRDEVYHDNKEKWVCSCLSFIVNSRYLCKHLVSFYSLPHPDGNGRFVVRPPPPFRPEFDVQLTGSDAVISAGVDQNDSELESLQLLPTEHPEAAEENDEEAMEALRVFETLGISRSVGKNTIRKAQKSYFHMRGQNQSRTPGNE
ncbi:hypothetical protein V1506DRAFT_553367 [Lipomyces tetrasporus]